MLRQESSRSDDEYDELVPSDELPQNQSPGFDIQRELNRLEEMILDSPRIMLTRRTLVDEEQLLEQLDLVRLNLPDAFTEALEIIRYKEDIFLQAEQYAQDIIESAKQRAAQILDETGIIRRAEIEASQIRQQVQQECEEIKHTTLNQVEQSRHQALRELEQLRQLALDESEEIQKGADDYADAVLIRLEQQLRDMLRVVRNGREQLYGGSQPQSQRSQDPDS